MIHKQLSYLDAIPTGLIHSQEIPTLYSYNNPIRALSYSGRPERQYRSSGSPYPKLPQNLNHFNNSNFNRTQEYQWEDQQAMGLRSPAFDCHIPSDYQGHDNQSRRHYENTELSYAFDHAKFEAYQDHKMQQYNLLFQPQLPSAINERLENHEMGRNQSIMYPKPSQTQNNPFLLPSSPENWVYPKMKLTTPPPSSCLFDSSIYDTPTYTQENSDPDFDFTPQRSQKLKCENDKYTPSLVRGVGAKKEGQCGICGRWLLLKTSAYWYHLNYTHGVSPVTKRFYDPPVNTRAVWVLETGKDSSKSSLNVPVPSIGLNVEFECASCE